MSPWPAPGASLGPGLRDLVPVDPRVVADGHAVHTPPSVIHSRSARSGVDSRASLRWGRPLWQDGSSDGGDGPTVASALTLLLEDALEDLALEFRRRSDPSVLR